MGVTSGTGTAYLSGAPELFCRVCVAQKCVT